MVVPAGERPSDPALRGEMLDALEAAIGRGLVDVGARDAAPPSTEPETRRRPDTTPEPSVIDGILDDDYDDHDTPRTLCRDPRQNENTLLRIGPPPVHRSGVVTTPRREEIERMLAAPPPVANRVVFPDTAAMKPVAPVASIAQGEMISLPKGTAILSGMTPAEGVLAPSPPARVAPKPPVPMNTTVTLVTPMPWAAAPAARPAIAFEATTAAPAPVPPPHVPPPPVFNGTMALPPMYTPAHASAPIPVAPMQHYVPYPPQQAWPAPPQQALLVHPSPPTPTARRTAKSKRRRSSAPLATLLVAIGIAAGLGVDPHARASSKSELVAQSRRIASRAAGLQDRLRPPSSF